MAIITSFEVLAQPLVPGVPDVPYVQQGTFVQISNPTAVTVALILGFIATPNFVAEAGPVSLFANFISDTGDVTQVSGDQFIANGNSFPEVNIPAGGTYIFGLQYLLGAPQSATLLGSTPQDGQGTRGFIMLRAQPGASLLVLTTIRQVFTNFDPSGNVQNLSEAAYSVPLVGGPLQQF